MFVTISLLLAAACLLPAAGKLTGQPRMRKSAAHFRIPWPRYRLIGVTELAAAAGILTGLRWHPSAWPRQPGWPCSCSAPSSPTAGQATAARRPHRRWPPSPSPSPTWPSPSAEQVKGPAAKHRACDPERARRGQTRGRNIPDRSEIKIFRTSRGFSLPGQQWRVPGRVSRCATVDGGRPWPGLRRITPRSAPRRRRGDSEDVPSHRPVRPLPPRPRSQVCTSGTSAGLPGPERRPGRMTRGEATGNT